MLSERCKQLKRREGERRSAPTFKTRPQDHARENWIHCKRPWTVSHLSDVAEVVDDHDVDSGNAGAGVNEAEE